MNQDLWRRSAVELAAMIRAREVSCVEATESVLERIARHNGRINAIVVDGGEEALRAAEQKDRETESGADLGPLHGVPVTIKENIDVAGQATPNGLPAYADVIAPDHSPVTRNLLDAGAIVVGRTNTPELSMRATTDNPLRGRTLNPWDEDVRRRAGLPAGRRPQRRWGSGRFTTATTSADRCASPRSHAGWRR